MVKLRGNIYLAAAFFLAGSSVVAAHFLAGRLGIFTISAVSLFLALIGLLPLCWRKLGLAYKNMGKRERISIALQALLGMFLFRVFLLTGLNHTSAAEAGILTGVTPAFTALLAFLALKESMYAKRIIGIASTVAGVLLIQGLLTAGSHLSFEHAAGNVLVLAAALCESLFNVLSRQSSISITGQAKMDPLVQSALVTAAACILCLVPAALENPAPALAVLGWRAWMALLWYGFMVTALGYICWYAGIKRSETSSAAVFSGLMPLTAMVLSVLLLGEQATTRQCLGCGLVVLGMLAAGSSPPAASDGSPTELVKPV